MGITVLSHHVHEQFIPNTGIEASSLLQDNESGFSIRRSAITNPKLPDSIGRAQMEQEILRRTIPVIKKYQGNLEQETGIHSSLTEDDAKRYLEEVIKEIK